MGCIDDGAGCGEEKRLPTAARERERKEKDKENDTEKAKEKAAEKDKDSDKAKGILGIFRAWDSSGSGVIPVNELMRILTMLRIDGHEADKLLRLAGAGREGGLVDYEQFCRWLFSSAPECLCEHGCGRPPRVGQLYCCQTCVISRGKRHGKRCEAAFLDASQGEPPAESRGITLEQLRKVRAEIAARCQPEGWADLSGRPLEPEALNLYDLNHYVILPQTVPSGIRIVGCGGGAGLAPGCELRQASTRARGRLTAVDEERGSLVMNVQVLAGRFTVPRDPRDLAVAAGGKALVSSQGANIEVIEVTPVVHSSYVGLHTRKPQKPLWFVSHWWGEPVFAFVDVLEEHARVRGIGEQVPYWVCAYANAQHDLGGEVTTDPYNSSFFRALAECEGIVLVLNEASKAGDVQAAKPFTRIWCAFEIHMALTNRGRSAESDDKPPLLLDIGTTQAGRARLVSEGLGGAEARRETITSGGGYKLKADREQHFPVVLLQAGMSVFLERAESSVEADRRHILNSLAGVKDLEAEPPDAHERFDAANRRLRGIFAAAAWPNAFAKGMAEDMGLPQTLAADTDCRNLVFSLQGIAVDDAGAMLLAKSLPPNLRSLSLDLAGAPVGDMALRALAQGLARLQELRDLAVNISGTGAGDEGFAALVAGLPRGELAKLALRVRETSIGDSGLRALGGALPGLGQLRELLLNCAKCRSLTDAALADFGTGLRAHGRLANLTVNFGACEAVTDAGATSLMEGVRGLLTEPRRLERFQATFSQTRASKINWKIWGLSSLRKRLAKKGP